MDIIDEKLLLALREDGRASTAKLARLVGRSRTSVQSRIERLQKQGVIVGFGVLLAPEHGLGAVRAHVMIKVGPKETRAVTAALRSIPQVRVLHSVSGDVDLIAVAATASVTEMDEVIDRVGSRSAGGWGGIHDVFDLEAVRGLGAPPDPNRRARERQDAVGAEGKSGVAEAAPERSGVVRRPADVEEAAVHHTGTIAGPAGVAGPARCPPTQHYVAR